MNKLLLLIYFFGTAVATAQLGFNYKAVVKDGSGNIVSNQSVTTQFSILEGAGLINVYQETHIANTDTNGILVLVIGTGTTSDVFTDIDWSILEHSLNVQVDTGGGLIDLGTTSLQSVPYALAAANVSGLEGIDEGNGTGWRYIGTDANNYGSIGNLATDLSASISASTTLGATGAGSTALGVNTTASGSLSIASGLFTSASGLRTTTFGFSSTASGQNATAFGDSTTASGEEATALGFFTTASGDQSTALGERTNAEASHATAIGRYNTGGGTSDSWVSSDPLFEVGNGTTNNARSNALTVYKDGSLSVNDAYTLPNIDGTENQILTTDGSGVASWSDEADGDSTNEIQDLTIAGDELQISGGGASASMRAFINPNFPDGLDGAQPVTQSLGTAYTVPAGKNLFITQVFLNPGNSILINGIQVKFGASNRVVAQGIVNPLVAGAGDVISGTSGAFNGILTNAGVTPITSSLTTYTVPAGKIFVLLSVSGPFDTTNGTYGGVLIVDNATGIQLYEGLGNNMDHNASNTQNSFFNPMFFESGQVVNLSPVPSSFPFGWNGYLMDN